MCYLQSREAPLHLLPESATIAREGEGAIPVRVAAMSSVIDWVVDETNFRFILFLIAQTVAVGSLVVVALREQHARAGAGEPR